MGERKDDTEVELSEREIAIAKRAAKLAMQELSDDFYKRVGKTVITRVLVWIGAFALGLGYAKGWISLGPPK